MTEKIIAKIKRYPFQTGIAVGVIVCLFLSLFFSLFRDHGKTLSGNSDIIREDYLRMTINAYTENRDAQLAAWRFSHLGGDSGKTLRLMEADTSIDPYDIASFAKAVEKEEVFVNKTTDSTSNSAPGTPTNPKKGISGAGKVILILFIIAVAAAIVLYAGSLIKTKKKQKRRDNVSKLFQDETPINMVQTNRSSMDEPEKKEESRDSAPDFNLDSLFAVPEKKPITQEPSCRVDSDEPDVLEVPSEDDPDISNNAVESAAMPVRDTVAEETEYVEKHSEEDDDEEEDFKSENNIPDEETEPDQRAVPAHESVVIGLKDAEPEASGYGLRFTDSRHDIRDSEGDMLKAEEAEVSETEKQDIPNPLIEDESAPESDDPLLKMIRNANTVSTALDESPTEPTVDFITEPEAQEEDEPQNDMIIHYQSTYRIGNDMFDEIFSIDQGDNFRGECGIGIGETLNNTEPKAVTAFEIWLFDRDDIHTATNYLLSDFAAQNEKISERLRQHGSCNLIRKNAVYTLETRTLLMNLEILDLEYGSEMQEKNSYFTAVTFDISVRSKPVAQ